tara:strand:- start:51 stop:704 length:654 start_codon:yes stop_codon:yes gene_type:complete
MEKQQQASNPKIATDEIPLSEEMKKQLTSRVPKPKPKKTTFQMTEIGYANLNKLASKWEYSVGAVIAALLDMLDDAWLKTVVNTCVEQPFEATRIRRSYTVEKETLSALRVLKKHKLVSSNGLTRDDIIERCALLALILMEQHEKKRIEAVKEARGRYSELLDSFFRSRKKVEASLSDFPDDPICARLNTIEIILQNLESAIYDEINEGIPVDPQAW